MARPSDIGCRSETELLNNKVTGAGERNKWGRGFHATRQQSVKPRRFLIASLQRMARKRERKTEEERKMERYRGR
jgi:hypothetical protein